MRYVLPTPKMPHHPLGAPLLSRPDLGPGASYEAIFLLNVVYRTPARPGLDTHRDMALSEKWSRTKCKIIGEDFVMRIADDLSALIFAQTDDPEIYRVLPIIFMLPEEIAGDGLHIPTLLQEFGSTGTASASLPLSPDAKRLLDILEFEIPFWVRASAKVPLDKEQSWPVPLSWVLPSSAQGRNGDTSPLSTWFMQICTAVSGALNAQQNVIAIKLKGHSLSQVDGTASFSIEVETIDDANPALRNLAEHIETRIADLLHAGCAPVTVGELLPLVPPDDDRCHSAYLVTDKIFDLEEFALIDLSNHQRLALEGQFDFSALLASSPVSIW